MTPPQWDDDAGNGSETKLSIICWNVCGWGKNRCGVQQMMKFHDMKAEVLGFYRPDVMALVETWLKGDEVIDIERYLWFGRNRNSLHRKGVRGSGGIGCLLHKEVLEGSRSR